MPDMNQLDRLEALAQSLIEGTFNRLFQSQLHPAQSPPPNTSAWNGRRGVETKKALTVNNSGHTATNWVLQNGMRRLQLGQPVINVGRAQDNDIVFDDPSVSLYHAQLRWREGRYHLCPPTADTEQANRSQKMGQSAPRITVNRQPVIRHPLSSGDVIGLGETILTVHVEQV